VVSVIGLLKYAVQIKVVSTGPARLLQAALVVWITGDTAAAFGTVATHNPPMTSIRARKRGRTFNYKTPSRRSPYTTAPRKARIANGYGSSPSKTRYSVAYETEAPKRYVIERALTDMEAPTPTHNPTYMP